MTKIMIVEDDNSLREIYSIRLTAEGYEVVSAADGEDALAMAVREKPDLILSDVMMPKISGFDMLDILRQTPETKDIKVIMMTALSSDDQRARGEGLGADRYLVKSQVGIEDVINAIHDTLGDRSNMSTSMADAQPEAADSGAAAQAPEATVPVSPASPAPAEPAMPTSTEMPVTETTAPEVPAAGASVAPEAPTTPEMPVVETTASEAPAVETPAVPEMPVTDTPTAPEIPTTEAPTTPEMSTTEAPATPEASAETATPLETTPLAPVSEAPTMDTPAMGTSTMEDLEVPAPEMPESDATQPLGDSLNGIFSA